MSGRAVLSWVVVAAVLAGVYLLLGGPARRGDAPARGGDLLRIPIDPAQIERVEVVAGDERVSVERASWSSTGWVLRWSEEGRELAWAAREQRVRGALRALSSARLGARGGVDDDALESEWYLHSTDGGRVRVELRSGGVGGRRGIRVFDGSDGVGIAAWAARDMASVMAPEAMMAWRDGAALPRVGSGASSLTIEGGGARVVLGRSRGAWHVREPVETRAETGVVEDALGRLGTLDAGEGGGLWVGNSDDEVTGLDQPIAVVELETVQRVPDGEGFRREVTRQRLEIGGNARASGATRFVRARSDVIVEGEVDPTRRMGPAVFAMDVSAMSRLTSSVEAYVSRSPSEVAASDVGVIRVLDESGGTAGAFERDRRGWVRAGAESGLPGGDQRAIGRLLQIACQESAARVEVLGAESEVDGRLCEVRLESLGGTVLGAFEVGVSGDGAALVLRDGAVFWISESDGRAAVIGWLRSVLGE